MDHTTTPDAMHWNATAGNTTKNILIQLLTVPDVQLVVVSYLSLLDAQALRCICQDYRLLPVSERELTESRTMTHLPDRGVAYYSARGVLSSVQRMLALGGRGREGFLPALRHGRLNVYCYLLTVVPVSEIWAMDSEALKLSLSRGILPISWLEAKEDHVSSNFVLWASAANQTVLVQEMLSDAEPKAVLYLEYAVQGAAQGGHQELLAWLRPALEQQVAISSQRPSRTIKHLVEQDPGAQHLLTLPQKVYRDACLLGLARKGDVASLSCELRDDDDLLGLMNAAIVEGQLPTLQYLAGVTRITEYISRLATSAASHDQGEILEYLLTLIAPDPSPTADQDETDRRVDDVQSLLGNLLIGRCLNSAIVRCMKKFGYDRQRWPDRHWRNMALGSLAEGNVSCLTSLLEMVSSTGHQLLPSLAYCLLSTSQAGADKCLEFLLSPATMLQFQNLEHQITASSGPETGSKSPRVDMRYVGLQSLINCMVRGSIEGVYHLLEFLRREYPQVGNKVRAIMADITAGVWPIKVQTTETRLQRIRELVDHYYPPPVASRSPTDQ
jgi:hypothetical protein